MVGARVFPRCIDRNDRSTLSIIALWTTVNYIRAVSWHLISKERDVFVSRERERGEADASSKQKITSGKREDEDFMTKRRRFAADVATPFRRDRCRGICFYLIAGLDRGWAMEKERRKNETECAFAGVISTIISQTMEAHRAMGHRWPRDLGQYFFTASFDRRGCSSPLLFCRERNRNRGRIEESLRSFSIFEKVGRSMENPIYPPG